MLSAAVPEGTVDLVPGEVGGDGKQLDRVEGAGAQLYLLGGAVDEELFGFDPVGQIGVEPEDAVDAEDVGDEVVGEGRQLLDAREVGDAGPVQVGCSQLGSLEEWDPVAVIPGSVGE